MSVHGLVDHAETTWPWVAITFDTCNGGIGANTDQLLGIFRAHGMTGTLNVVGEQVRDNPIQTRNILAYGCEIGNHSFSHSTLTAELDHGYAEYRKAQLAIRMVTGYLPCTCRPPGGHVDSDVIAAAASLGLTTVKWGHSPNIFDGDPDHIAATALDGIVAGQIVLMHANAVDIAALPAILDGLTQRGLRSVPVVRLLGGHFTRQPKPKQAPVLGAASESWSEPPNVFDEV